MRTALALAALIATAVPARAETVVAEWSGSGAMTTRPMTFSGPWELQWQADGIFLAHAVQRGNMAVSVLANQAGAGSGSSAVVPGGTYFISVNALAPWKARAVLVGP